jgi:hypothetical protein
MDVPDLIGIWDLRLINFHFVPEETFTSHDFQHPPDSPVWAEELKLLPTAFEEGLFESAIWITSK